MHVSLVRSRPVLLLIAALAASAMTPAIAAAAERRAVELEVHCVVQVVDKATDGELATSAPTCFATFEEAAALAAGGVARPSGGGAGIDGFAMSTFTLGIHYNGYNGTGSSITVVGSSCTGGYWNTPSWFDNKTTSSYNGCGRLRHYDKPNRMGSSTNTYGAGTTDNLSSWMNNRTESVAYYSS